MHFSLSLAQVLVYSGVWIGLDAIKAVCGHEVDKKPMFFLTFFATGLIAVGFYGPVLLKTLAP
jgi:hypothetical protein